MLAHRAIPMVIVNGRLSDRSFPRWRRFRLAVAPLFGRLPLVLAQSGEDAARFSTLGARNVVATRQPQVGFCRRARCRSWPSWPASRAAIGSRPVWLAASTHAGEEEIAVATHRAIAAARPGLLTLLVPRHPQRGDAVAAMLAAAGMRVARRSRGEAIIATTEVYLADTLGELGLFYRLVPVAFIGNSLVAGGGHNPVEAVQLGAAVVYGPHVENFSEVFARLDRAWAAARVADASGLAAIVGALIADPAKAQAAVATEAAGFAGMTGAARRHGCRAPSLPRRGSAAIMRASAPDFWWRPRASLAAILLWPLSLVWRIGAARRMAQPSRFRSPVAVVCVGNYVVGGAGARPRR